MDDTDKPKSEPLGLNLTSSPSTSSGVGVLLARGMMVNLARLVLILHFLSKGLIRTISMLVRAFSILLERPGWKTICQHIVR